MWLVSAGAKNIFVYPFSLNPEGTNPSGAVNFSKVSHAKLKLHFAAPPGTDFNTSTDSTFNPTAAGAPAQSSKGYRVDIYGLYYNWLQIKDGRGILSFA